MFQFSLIICVNQIKLEAILNNSKKNFAWQSDAPVAPAVFMVCPNWPEFPSRMLIAGKCLSRIHFPKKTGQIPIITILF